MSVHSLKHHKLHVGHLDTGAFESLIDMLICIVLSLLLITPLVMFIMSAASLSVLTLLEWVG